MTEEQLPTAEEFFRKKIIGNSEPFPVTLWPVNINAETGMRWAHEYAVLFARHHVQEALKEASKQAKLYVRDDNEYPETIDSDSILNAYNLDKII